jgi:phage/plasmid-like protein (TIGR03299 family)
VLDKDVMTSEEAMKVGGLDWEVELAPTYHYVKKEAKEVPDRFVVRRTDTFDVLGTVGSHYVLFQNSEVFSFGDYLVETGAAKWTFVGQAKGGRQIVAVMKLPDSVTVAGGDALSMYMLFRTAHDGTKAISVAVTPIRHACTNVMSLSLYSADIKQKWSVQHVSTVQERLGEAKDTLKLASRYTAEFKLVADQLAATDMTIKEFEGILTRVLPNRPKTPEVIGRMTELLRTSPNIHDEHRKTAWGGLNAVTEFMDWKRDSRGSEARFLTTIDGVNNQVRNRAAALLLRKR